MFAPSHFDEYVNTTPKKWVDWDSNSRNTRDNTELTERMQRDFGNTVVTTIDNMVQVNNGEDEEECPF